nr:hypothetical protein [Tanacetum cinerariifolium]
MGMAVILDPRYKIKILELLLPKIYGQEKTSNEIKTLEEYVKSLFKEYEASAPCAKVKVFEDVGSSPSSSSGPRTGFKSFFQTLLQLPTNMMTQVTNGSKDPTLQRIAKYILAILVSTVASESAFSTSERLIRPHRSRLHPKTLEALMCVKSWLLNEIQETPSQAEGEKAKKESDIANLEKELVVDVEMQNVQNPHDSRKGKGITTDEIKEPIMKLVPTSREVRQDPDEPIRVPYEIHGKIYQLTNDEIQAHLDKEENIKKAVEEAKRLEMTKSELIKVVHEKASKAGIDPKILERRKRTRMKLEPEICIPALECNMILPEGMPFVNNMVIEELEYGMFFTDVFGDEAF